MIVIVNPDASAFIAGGHDPSQTEVDVDLGALNQEDRELLARSLELDRDGRRRLPWGVYVDAPTGPAIFQALRQREQVKAESELEARLKFRAELERVAAERKTVKRHGSDIEAGWPWTDTAEQRGHLEEVRSRPEIKAWEAELKAENDRREEAAIAAKHAREEDKRAAVEAKRADRDRWIAEHGSERLRRAATEGIECGAIYRDERLACERPGWEWGSAPGWTSNGERLLEPRNPPEEAFVLLDQARKLAPESKLAYVMDSDGEEDDDTEYDDGDVCVESTRVTQYVAHAELLGRVIVLRA